MIDIFLVSYRRINEILNSNESWSFIYPDPLEDEMKIPMCADHFIRLLDAIKKRYCILVEKEHQLKFLTLQNELIEKFTFHLMEIEQNNEIKIVKILNAIQYIITVLSELSENFHYLHLQTVSTSLNEDINVNIVFEGPMNILKEWNKTLLHKLANNVNKEIINKLSAYRDVCWSSIPDDIPAEILSVSPIFGDVLQKIYTNLFALKDQLALNLFNDMLRIIARKIDDYLLRNIIMSSKFSSGGITQFNFDIKSYLFIAFNEYILHADLLFVKYVIYF